MSQQDVNKPIDSGRSTPTQTLKVPSQTKTSEQTDPSRTSQRTKSPARLSAELYLKCRTQMCRVESIRKLVESIPDSATDTSLGRVTAQITQLEELHKAFLKEHAYFEVTWPESFLDHEYFSNNVHFNETLLVCSDREALTQLKHELTEPLLTQNLTTQLNRPAHPRLPEISLPSFDGSYTAWPQFKELFSSVIMDSSRLTNVEKLHYLRSSLKGSPAQLIQNLSMTGDSLMPSWELLIGRYENKRLIIQAHLDQLSSIRTPAHKNASSLTKLISTVTEATNALQSLGISEQLGNCMLVHHVSRFLDSDTREAWETSLGASQEFPKFELLMEFLTAKARALERVEAANAQSKPTQRKATAHHASSKPTTPSSSANQSKPAPYACDMCNANHFITQRSCMQINSRVQNMFCSTSHHASLNFIDTDTADHLTPSASSGYFNLITLNNMLRRCCNRQPGNSVFKVNTHIVSHCNGTRSLIERLLTQLSLKRQHSSVSITGIGGNQTTQTKGVVDLSLHSTHSHAAVTVRAHILKTLTTILPTFESPQQDWPHLQHLKLADPDFLKPRAIDLIIGADSYGQVIKPNIKKYTSDSPVAQLSVFGWLVLGPVRSTIPTHTRTAHHTKVLQHDTNLEELLTKFWIQEEPPTATTASLTTDEQECETHFRTTHSRDSTGRYIVRIPFKLSTSVLGNSYEAARRSLQGTLKRFKRDSELQKLYTQFMQEYEQLDHMAKIPSTTSRSSTHYYLPHHGVLKPDSETTKLRVVFNGSCATSTGFSLNDTMYTGANLLLNIFDVLIWIRQHRYLFSTDITKMYRQIKVHPSDWDLQRIIWIDELYNEVLYYLTTVTYGTKAAPFLAVRTLLQLAKDEGHRFPLALPPIERGRCVDDMFGGSDTIKHLIKIAHQLKDLCNAGGFPLAKWHSNHPELLKAISSKTVAHSSVSLDDCNTKLLGLKWSPQEDTFSVSTMLPAHQGQFTKRLILSEVAQIFDPLGFLSPVVIKAKMLLQELWLHKLSWDDPLPFQVVSRWLNIRKDLTSLARLSIPRWFNTTSSSIVDLHGFSDASQFAMAAVIYLTAYTPSTGTQSTFICSKTKVAPLKRLTIPRLELTAALLLAKLMKHVLATLTMDIRDTCGQILKQRSRGSKLMRLAGKTTYATGCLKFRNSLRELIGNTCQAQPIQLTVRQEASQCLNLKPMHFGGRDHLGS
ncbi:uncharacterized protein [Temnothorax nylanderi]|uniref:uncharacterized protein n=1 Tax=Temnothorax nylanderi TaxID=102681 RepID=UPI003A871358